MGLKKDVEGLFRWLHSALCNRYNTEATVIPGWGKVGTDINYPEGGTIVSGHLEETSTLLLQICLQKLE